ncbi:MAG: cellulase family glycosylhydrolase [Verrucomicrobia bacterium]|nr:cellulase family glycosylhydrolase [Verrucomicrobiota bacterium]
MPGRTHSLRKFLAIACAVAAMSGLQAETRHVSPDGSDTGPGSEKSPWRTIQRGLDRLNPGDTLMVHAGTYQGPAEIRKPGTMKKRITIRGLEGASIKSPADAPAVVVPGTSWITWEGFSVAGEIAVSGNPEGLVVSANRLRGEGTGCGIRLANARSALIERNMVSGFEQGIVVAGSGVIVRNNIVRQNSRAGIVLGNLHPALDTLVRNNTAVANGGSPDAAGGLWIRYARNPTIENNIIVSGPGRRLFTAEGDDLGDRFLHNLYFSPSGAEGAVFCRSGKMETGFVMIRLATRDPGAVFADPVFSDATASLHRSSPAIDVSPAQPFPGEKDFLGRPRRAGLGTDAGAVEFEHATGLRREGTELVHQNNPVRLRGVGIGDPVLERRSESLSHYEVLRQKWNANVVRISVHSYVWRNAELFGGRAGVLDQIRREIGTATRAGLFVILDWHITGWPDGFSRPPDPGEPAGFHDSSFALACDFWNEASRVFGKNGLVAFEIWNEPVRGPNNWQPEAAEWRLLRPFWERLIAIIRRNSDNLIIVAGGSWAYSMKGIRDLPPSDPNIAFSWHVYAGKENNDEARWAAAFDNLSKDFPVIVSEWGFEETGAPYFKGGVEDFGAKFATNWLEGRDLHWVAWCWHSEIKPAMLRPDWTTPTPFGAFVKSLLRLNPVSEPPNPKFLFAPAALPPASRPDFLR